MANRRVKCPHCEEFSTRGETIKHTNGRYYHKDCYEIATQEARDYKDLIETICRIWGINAPTMQMVRQLKLYREDPELKCTNKGMQLTLEYYYDLLGNNPREFDGVGIIPYYYDRVKDYYIKIMETEESVDDYEENKSVKVVKINRTERKRNIRVDNIDINSL